MGALGYGLSSAEYQFWGIFLFKLTKRHTKQQFITEKTNATFALTGESHFTMPSACT